MLSYGSFAHVLSKYKAFTAVLPQIQGKDGLKLPGQVPACQTEEQMLWKICCNLVKIKTCLQESLV
jgi:hypothetical protein